MADNVTLNAGTGGDVLAADDVGGAKYQRVKVVWGADGVVNETTTTDPFPATITNDASRALGTVGLTQYTPVDVDSGAGTLNALPVVLKVTGSGGVEIAGDATNGLDVDVTRVGGTVTIGDGSGSITVDNAGTFVVQDDQKITDNAGFTDGTSKVMMAGWVFDETAGTALTENDAAAGRIDSKRAVVSVIEDETTRGRRVTVTASNALKVDASSVAVPVTDNSGSLTVDGTVTAANTAGDVAHDTADSGNPVKLGGKATNSLHGLTLVANNDRTDLYAGLDGVQIVRPHSNLESLVSGNASDTAGTSTEVIAAAGVGIKQYLMSVTLTNTSSTNTYCELKSGTTVKWTLPVPANGGVTHSWPIPLPPNAANEAWNFDMGTAVTTAYCSMLAFKSKI